MDGNEAIEVDEADLLSDDAVMRLRGHPRFQEAAEALASDILRRYEADDPAGRWLMKDLGRAALYLASVLLDGTPAGLTVGALAGAATAGEVCSRGRVLAFVQYALASGRFVLEPGPEYWVRRRLTPTALFIEPIRQRFCGGLDAAAIVAPEVAAALPRLARDSVVRQATSALALVVRSRPELHQNPGGPLREIFIARDGGSRILQHLMLSQTPGRARLLEAAPLSRSDLSRRYGVSRTHVNRLLADAEAVGALRLDGRDRVVFSPAFSDETEAYFAGQLQVQRAIAQVLMSDMLHGQSAG